VEGEETAGTALIIAFAYVHAPTETDNAPVGNPLTIRPERLRRLRELCLSLPEATEKEAWGDPTWRVRDRIFAMQKGNFEGGRPSVWVKAPEGDQRALVASDPHRYFVPSYVGHKGWVGVHWTDRRSRGTSSAS